MTNYGGTTLYDTNFYDEQRRGSADSAQVIAPKILELVEVRSALDLGCGVGTWLRVLQQRGVDDVLGVDGDYVERNHLEIDPDRFMPADLSKKLSFDRKYDIALCLEVGEHLPVECAPMLIDSLCDASDVVLFSAAIPFQGGTGHINCQWQGWWANMFRERGFEPFDALRPSLWYDARVEPWYRQNILIYARGERAAALRARVEQSQLPLDVVHPAEIERAMLGVPRVRDIISDLKLALTRRVKTFLGRDGQVPRRPEQFGLTKTKFLNTGE